MVSVEKKKVGVEELQVGMFVCDLDRSWLETLYPLQGFLIKSAEELHELQSKCDYVFIDVVKTRANSEIKHSYIQAPVKACSPSSSAPFSGSRINPASATASSKLCFLLDE